MNPLAALPLRSWASVRPVRLDLPVGVTAPFVVRVGDGVGGRSDQPPTRDTSTWATVAFSVLYGTLRRPPHGLLVGYARRVPADRPFAGTAWHRDAGTDDRPCLRIAWAGHTVGDGQAVRHVLNVAPVFALADPDQDPDDAPTWNPGNEVVTYANHWHRAAARPAAPGFVDFASASYYPVGVAPDLTCPNLAPLREVLGA